MESYEVYKYEKWALFRPKTLVLKKRLSNILTMKNKVKIKYACDKQWSSMSKIDDMTNYCSFCDKNIIDYSGQQILEPQKIYCGRFSLAQVSSVQREFTMKKLSPLTLTLLSVIGATIEPQDIQGQTQTITKEIVNQKNDKVRLSGIVKDKTTNEPLLSVSVVVKSSNDILAGTVTDFDGIFSLTFDTTTNKLENIEVIFSYTGYKQDTLRVVSIPKDLLDKEVTISLEAALNIENEVIPTNYRTVGLISIEPTQNKDEKKKK